MVLHKRMAVLPLVLAVGLAGLGLSCGEGDWTYEDKDKADIPSYEQDWVERMGPFPPGSSSVDKISWVLGSHELGTRQLTLFRQGPRALANFCMTAADARLWLEHQSSDTISDSKICSIFEDLSDSLWGLKHVDVDVSEYFFWKEDSVLRFEATSDNMRAIREIASKECGVALPIVELQVEILETREDQDGVACRLKFSMTVKDDPEDESILSYPEAW